MSKTKLCSCVPRLSPQPSLSFATGAMVVNGVAITRERDTTASPDVSHRHWSR